MPTMTQEMTKETKSTALSKNFFYNGANMNKQTKNALDWHNIYCNDEEFEIDEKPHYLDKCQDISPERFNEIVLEAIKEFNAKQLKKVAS